MCIYNISRINIICHAVKVYKNKEYCSNKIFFIYTIPIFLRISSIIIFILLIFKFSLTILNHHNHVFSVLKNSRWIITTIIHDNMFWHILHFLYKLLDFRYSTTTMMIIYFYNDCSQFDYNYVMFLKTIVIVFEFLCKKKKCFLFFNIFYCLLISHI